MFFKGANIMSRKLMVCMTLLPKRRLPAARYSNTFRFSTNKINDDESKAKTDEKHNKVVDYLWNAPAYIFVPLAAYYATKDPNKAAVALMFYHYSPEFVGGCCMREAIERRVRAISEHTRRRAYEAYQIWVKFDPMFAGKIAANFVADKRLGEHEKALMKAEGSQTDMEQLRELVALQASRLEMMTMAEKAAETDTEELRKLVATLAQELELLRAEKAATKTDTEQLSKVVATLTEELEMMRVEMATSRGEDSRS